MILWINGAFGSGKTTTAYELNRRIPNSFVYDPENTGYYIRKNTPKHMITYDFQDIPLWRETNYKMLRMISEQYEGTIIVPMTLVNAQYFDEIVTKLRGDGVEIKHYVLMASRETLLRRLRSRGQGIQSWAAEQIDRCVAGLKHERFETHIQTDAMTVEEMIQAIASHAQIAISPDTRSEWKKKLDRILVKVKHIRI